MKEIVVNSYLNKACAIVQDYLELHENKKTPLNHFLKNYFKANSKFGKRDRQSISDLVYSYFKLGQSINPEKIKERIQIASFLSMKEKNNIYSSIVEHSDLNQYYDEDFKARLTTIQQHVKEFNLANFIPFKIEFTAGIDLEKYFASFFLPAGIFIRVIEKHLLAVETELDEKQIPYSRHEHFANCIKIKKQCQLQDLKTWQSGYFEIQDISSQAISPFLNPKKNEYWWDMCAASGGKSLLLLSKSNQLNLLCSDSRESILKNLKTRISRIGFQPEIKVIDLSRSLKLNSSFNGIICDAPCSGSGTWKRNPEELFFFTPEKLENYTLLQKKILHNGINNRDNKTNFLYITCSVFASENEHQLSTHNELLFENNFLNYFDEGGNALFASVIKV